MKKKDIFQEFVFRFPVVFLMIVISLFSSCEKEKNDPKVETISIVNLSISEYEAKATITDRGDYNLIDHGFVYYIARVESEIQYYNGTQISLGETINSNSFSTIIDLSDIYSYYYESDYACFVRAYVTNEKGTVYGNIISTDLLGLKVTSVYPSSGCLGDTVTINGNLFSTTPSLNQVYFNNASAQVISSTVNTLQVIVPQYIQSYYYSEYLSVTVRVDGKEKTLEDAFYLETSVVSFSPYSGSWGTNINITGFGLVNSSLYFDDFFVDYYEYNSTSISASVPYNIGKKQFKIYVYKNGNMLEVPGGYFILNDLVVNPPSYSTYAAGSSIYFNGQMFNPQSNLNTLKLGNTTITAYDSYSSYAYFAIPNSMSPGTYQVQISNGIDTVTLNQSIQITL
jgi:IPT/TIG domain